MERGEGYSNTSVHFSKAIILLSTLVIIGVSTLIVWPRFSSNYFFKESITMQKEKREAMPDNAIRLDVQDILSSYYGEIGNDRVRNEDDDNVLIVSVPTSTPQTSLAISIYQNHDSGYQITYPSFWNTATSTSDTVFVFDEGSLLIGKTLHTSVPDTWREIDEYSDDGEEDYIRTYRHEEERDTTYYTFIQKDSESYVVTTHIPDTISFDIYFSVIKTFKTL